jgi:hypothetical protein
MQRSRRWLIISVLAGLLVGMICAAFAFLYRGVINTDLMLVVCPPSILSMGISQHATVMDGLSFWAVIVLANGILYGLLGSVGFGIYCSFRRLKSTIG